jgi:hypothetical protein
VVGVFSIWVISTIIWHSELAISLYLSSTLYTSISRSISYDWNYSFAPSSFLWIYEAQCT